MAKATETSTSSLSNLAKIKALKEKLSSSDGGGNRGDNGDRLPWFKSDGKVGSKFRIRILPIPFLDNPIIYVKEHRGLFPNKPYRSAVCPKSVGEGECPVCEYTYTKWKELKEKDDKAGMEALKPYMAKDKVYAVIYNRSTNKVEKMGMSTSLMNQIFVDWDPETEDVTDPYKGNDYTIKLSPSKQGSGFTYSADKVTNDDGSGHSTPVISDAKGKADKDAIQAILDEIAAHEQEIKWLTTPLPYEEMAKLLKHDADTGDETDESESSDSNSAGDDEDVEAALAAVRAKMGKK